MSKPRGPYRVDPLGHKKSQQALDKKAENARELGLDYEPEQQEPVAKHYVDGGHLVYPTAQRTWVGLTADEMEGLYQLATCINETDYIYMLMMAEAKLKEKNT